MAPSFRQYIDRKQNLLEAEGRSAYDLSLPITQPMANLLSIIKGPWMRARALDWLMFDGLKKAIDGREILVNIVNEKLGYKSKLPIPKPAAAPTAGSAAVSAMKAEGRDARALWGEDPFEEGETGPIRPCDLFSPEAWERRPELGRLRLGGMDIHQYYDMYYEPREMTIDYQPGKRVTVDIRKARDFLEAHRLQGFKYGGFEGYIQYTEKGDWQNPAFQKGGFSNNGQTGPDLRLDNRAGVRAVTLDDKGRTILNLKGGGYVKDERRSARTVDAMGSMFANVAQAIKSGKNVSNMNPEVVQNIRDIMSLNKQVKESEVSFDKDLKTKASAHRILFGKDTVRGESYFHVPSAPNLDLDSYLAIVKAGISRPLVNRQLMMRDGKTPIYNMSAIGPEWDGEGSPPPVTPNTGWYQIIGPDNTHFNMALPGNVQEAMFNYIIRDLESSGILCVRFRLNSVWPDIQAHNNVKIVVSALFNSGLKADPDLAKQFKRAFYTAPDIKQKDFINEVEAETKEIVNMADPANDPVLQPIMDSGYNWELRDSSERWLKSPNWLKYGDGVLKLGTDRLLVLYDRDPSVPAEAHTINKKGIVINKDGKPVELDQQGKPVNVSTFDEFGLPKGRFYLVIPKGTKGQAIEPASYGQLGSSMLSGGVAHKGGQVAGHIQAWPAGKKTYDKLLAMLMNGELGEGGKKVQNFTDLRTIKSAMHRAGLRWQRIAERDKLDKNTADEMMSNMYDWAEQGLKLFSGHPAFQVGYITPDEIQHILKWDEEKQKKLGRRGMGIQALLASRGLDDEETYNMIIAGVEDGFKNGPFMDYSLMDDDIRRIIQPILWQNAYQARVREVSKYIVAMITREDKIRKGEASNFEDIEGNGEEGEAGDGIAGKSEEEAKAALEKRGKWEDKERWRQLSDKNLRGMFGVQEPAVDPNFVPPHSPEAAFSNTAVKPISPKAVPPASYVRSKYEIEDDDIPAPAANANPASVPQIDMAARATRRRTSKPKPAAITPPANYNKSKYEADDDIPVTPVKPAPAAVAARATPSQMPPANYNRSKYDNE